MKTGTILGANLAFLNLTSIASDMQTVNQPLDRWLGRRGIDVRLLLKNLRDRGEIRRFETVIYPEYGEPIDVELSAVSIMDTDNPCLGFVIRTRLTKKASRAPKDEELPRSLKEMTELVGHVPLKDLVRETTDIIERMCNRSGTEDDESESRIRRRNARFEPPESVREAQSLRINRSRV